MICTDRFIKWIVTVGLILLITIQIMMRFDGTQHYLKLVESRIQGWVGTEVKEVVVFNREEYITLKLLNGAIHKARVLLNNERDYYFSKSTIQIPVKDGDLLILDTRGISEALWFEVIDFSDKITSLKFGQQFRVKNDLQVISIEVNSQRKF
ncbi:MAG: hypothetical protein KAX49_08675 [Halanaerobiales bacterium]|nr:hypothetical protein [Halanaerobiales bacterium]